MEQLTIRGACAFYEAGTEQDIDPAAFPADNRPSVAIDTAEGGERTTYTLRRVDPELDVGQLVKLLGGGGNASEARFVVHHRAGLDLVELFAKHMRAVGFGELTTKPGGTTIEQLVAANSRPQLVAMCEQRGEATHGTKRDLAERLQTDAPQTVPRPFQGDE